MALNQLGLGLLFTAKDLASGVMGKVRNGFAQTRDEMGKFGQRGREEFKNFGIGVGIMGAGIAGLALLAPATQMAEDFGFEIAKLRTVVDEASFSTDDLRANTMKLAASYGIDALKQADALYDVLGAGISDATKAIDMMEVANEFAIGGTTGLKGAVDVLTSAVNTYADQGLTAKSASDLMFKAIAAGKTTAEELAHSLGEVAPTAHAAGVSFAELQAAIAAMTVQGIKTPQAVTGLNALMSNLMKPTSDAAKEAKRLGIEFNATALKTLGLKGVLGQLIGNSKVNNDTFVNLFGSVEGVKAALTLTSSEGAKFKEVLGEMEKSAGATHDAFEIMANTTKFQGQRFDALWKNALILIGEGIEPLKANVLKLANTFLSAFAKIPKPFRDLLVQLVMVASTVAVVVGGVIALKAAFAVAGAALGTFGGGMLGGLVAAAAPAVAIIGLLVGVAYALKTAYDKNLGGIADKFRAVWSQIQFFAAAVYQLFTQGGFSGHVREAFQNGFETGPLNFAIKLYLLFNRVKNFLVGVWDGVKSVFEESDLFEGLVAAFEGLQAAFGLLDNDTDASGKAFDKWGKKGIKVGEILGQIVGVVIAGITAAINFATGIVEAWGQISPALDAVGDALGEVFSVLGDVIEEVTGASTASLSAGDVFKAVAWILSTAVGGALRLVAIGIRNFADMFRSVGTIIGGVVDVVAGIMTGDWGRVWNGAKRVVLGIVSGIIDAVMFIPTAIAQAVDAIGKLAGTDLGLGSKLKEFKDTMKTGYGQWMGVTAGGATYGMSPSVPEQSAPVPNSTPSSINSPAIASMGPANASFDPSMVSSAAAAAAQAAVSRVSVPPVHVDLSVDGERMASVVQKYYGANAAAAYGPVSVAE